MDIVVFGAGEEGKKAIPFLEKNYHILFFADNDRKKQGTAFGGYTVKSLDEVKKQNCNIVIASNRYGFEISQRLQQEGISRGRLYFCRMFCTDEAYHYEVCPVDEEKIESTAFPPIQYDLCHAEEQETDRKKVLIFCTFFSTYTKQLIENMSKRCGDIEFSLLTRAKGYKEKIISEHLKHIYYFRSMADLRAIMEQIPVYDAMQLLWIEWEWAYFYKLIRKKARRLNLNVGGSDFYRAEEDERLFKRNLIACADGITAETEATVREFGEYYGEEVKGKTHLLPFGVEVLEWIDHIENTPKNLIKEKYYLPSGKIIVTCGHNAIEKHQHMKIIDALEKLPENVKKQMVFVFPMTYPQGFDDYIGGISSRLEESGLEYKVLTEFMDFKSMAEYALISDIMIHVQTTDQLSSTMLEEMYAGSIVIAGKWLPYQSLHEMGIFFLDVGTVSGITASLEDAFANMGAYGKKCKGNRAIVKRHSSWDGLAPRWHALWG